jgi:energy-coupling factor transport system permease protein
VTAITILQGFLQPGSTIILGFPLFGLQATLTVEGITKGLYYSLRLFSISTAFIAFSISTTSLKISMALHQIGIPYKYSMLVGMALQSFPNASQLVKDIENAQAARGFDIKSGNILQRSVNFAPILVPLVIIIMHRAVDMAIVLELKGFSRKGRIYFTDETMPNRLDKILWLILPFIILVSVFLIK